jgi:predicted  nucleic acid-binding Zn-ribbon protein
MAQRRVEAAQLRLPELIKEVRRLRSEIRELKAKLDAKEGIS